MDDNQKRYDFALVFSKDTPRTIRFALQNDFEQLGFKTAYHDKVRLALMTYRKRTLRCAC